jgi:small subunit ribosomal protein S7
MSRKTRIFKKNIVSSQEPLYKDNILQKFINCLMVSGKKSIAERIIYDSFHLIKKELSQNPIDVFYKAVDNATPVVQVMSIRIAGSNYQVPVEIPPHKQSTLAIKWIIESSRNRSERTMAERLCRELIDASRNLGKSIDKKQTLHKMAEANRAYAHYRW